MSATREEAGTCPLGPARMRAAASWFLDQRTLPRHESLKLWHEDLTAFIEQLVRDVQQLAASLPRSDVPARVAMAGVGEAKRRLREPEAAGLHGETERVRRLARSVKALCDHHAALTGSRMCLACDKPIEDGRVSVPYDQAGPSGRAVNTGRVHASCVSAQRR